MILNTIVPLLPSCWGFSFTVGYRVSFFSGAKHSLVDGYSIASCDFGVLTGENECTSGKELPTYLSHVKDVFYIKYILDMLNIYI